MGTTETPPPLLLRNLIASLFLYAANSLLSFAQKFQLLRTFRFAFPFFLRFVPSFLLHCVLVPPANKPHAYDAHAPRNDSGIGRALSQLLYTVNDIPVSSRKYEVVRGLAERVIEENHREGSSGAHALRRVNQDVMASAFARTLSRLHGAARGGAGECGVRWRVLRAVGLRGVVEGNRNGEGVSGEKLAAELLWLAEKMAACGCGKGAVRMWAAAQHLGWLALSAEPRLQASLLKLAGIFTANVRPYILIFLTRFLVQQNSVSVHKKKKKASTCSSLKQVKLYSIIIEN